MVAAAATEGGEVDMWIPFFLGCLVLACVGLWAWTKKQACESVEMCLACARSVWVVVVVFTSAAPCVLFLSPRGFFHHTPTTTGEGPVLASSPPSRKDNNPQHPPPPPNPTPIHP